MKKNCQQQQQQQLQCELARLGGKIEKNVILCRTACTATLLWAAGASLICFRGTLDKVEAATQLVSLLLIAKAWKI